MPWRHWIAGKERREWARKEAAHDAALNVARKCVIGDSAFNSSAILLDALARDVLRSICRAEARRSIWHAIGRIGAASSSVAAAVTGGALTTGFDGIGATVVGGIALFLGLAGGITTALKADAEQTQDQHKAALYEELWWDISNYGVHYHPGAKLEARESKFAEFAQRRRQIKDPDPSDSRDGRNVADDAAH